MGRAGARRQLRLSGSREDLPPRRPGSIRVAERPPPCAALHTLRRHQSVAAPRGSPSTREAHELVSADGTG